MKPLLATLSLALALAASASAPAASLVIDSFDEGDHFLSFSGSVAGVTPTTGPLGPLRVATMIPRGFQSNGSTMTSTLSSVLRTVDFVANGPSINEFPHRLRITYSDGGPYSLAGYSAFEFDFSAVSGEGHLIVSIGGPDPYDPGAKRTLIKEAGIVTVPFDQINITHEGSSIEYFRFIRFTFVATSDIHSFTLDEIRVVPEPSGLLLSALGASALLGVRRRRPIN